MTATTFRRSDASTDTAAATIIGGTKIYGEGATRVCAFDDLTAA